MSSVGVQQVVWSLVFLLAGVSCQLSEVFVGEGSQAVLPCRDDWLASNRPKIPDNLVITWTKVGRGTVWSRRSNGLQYWGSSWMKGGVPRVHCPHPQYHEGRYHLEVGGVTEDDAGRYACRLERGEVVIETQVMLYVLKVSVSPAVPVDGDLVSLSCSVWPVLSGVLFRWSFNGTPVPLRSQRGNDNNSVVMETASVSRMGTWSCKVDYGGLKGQASTHLSVKGIVHPLTDDTVVYAEEGSEVTLPCHFSPGSNPVSPGWERVKEGESPSLPSSLPRSPSLPRWDQSLVVRGRSSEDEGRYLCRGELEGHTLTRTMRLVLARVVSSNQKSSLLLSCQLSDPSEVTGYQWLRMTSDPNGTEWAGPIQEGRSLLLSREQLEEGGQWSCRFYGKNGLLGNATQQQHQTGFLSAFSSSSSSSSSSSGAMLVGLLFLILVLLLLLVLVQMYRNRRRRSRILQFPAMETIIHTMSNQREERERHRVKE